MSATQTTIHGRIKERAAYYINRFTAIGISHSKAKLCAVVLVEDLMAQYDTLFQKTDDRASDDARYGAATRLFEELIKAIKAF